MRLLAKFGVDRVTIIRFIAVGLCSQLVYSVDALRNVVFISYRDMLGISFAQIGILYSLTGIVQMAAYLPAGWIVNRFSNRTLLTVNSLLTAGLSVLLLLNVGYYPLLLVFALFGLTKEAVFWTAILRSVRCIASDDRQATAFGALEFMRGIIELATNLLVVILISWLGSYAGVRFAVLADILLMSAAAMLAWFVLPPGQSADKGAGRNSRAARGVLQAVRMKSVWLAGFNAGCVYVVYICLMYFAPFLQEVYGLPLSAVAVFALVNSSGMRMLSSPAAGLLGDRLFRSSAHFMRLFFLILALATLAITAMPCEKGMVAPLMVLFVVISVMTYMLRGVYFAPIGEMGISHEITGAAMSVASVAGYSPAFWTYWLAGWLIDTWPGAQGYRYLFVLMVAAAVLGFAGSCLMRDKMNRIIDGKAR